MSDPKSPLGRQELLATRRAHEMRCAVLRSRLIAWQAYVRASAAIAREYIAEDKDLSEFMIALNWKAVRRERELVAERESLVEQIAVINQNLRAGDKLMTLKELAAEDADWLAKHNGQ